MIDAGRLDARAVFEREVATADGGGGSAVAWTEQFTRWGALALPALRVQQEAIAAGAVQAPVGGTLTVHHDAQTATITAGWRVLLTLPSNVTQTWNIREVRPPLGDGTIRMSVEQGVPI